MPSCMRPEHDRLGHDLVVGVDRKDDLARLVGDDRAVGNQNGVDLAGKQLDAPEHARRKQQVLVVDDGAAADGAGARVELVVDEIHLADVRPIVLVGEADAHGIA